VATKVVHKQPVSVTTAKTLTDPVICALDAQLVTMVTTASIHALKVALEPQIRANSLTVRAHLVMLVTLDHRARTHVKTPAKAPAMLRPAYARISVSCGIRTQRPMSRWITYR